MSNEILKSDVILSLLKEKCMTVRDIIDSTDITSQRAARVHLKPLIDNGFVVKCCIMRDKKAINAYSIKTSKRLFKTKYELFRNHAKKLDFNKGVTIKEAIQKLDFGITSVKSFLTRMADDGFIDVEKVWNGKSTNSVYFNTKKEKSNKESLKIKSNSILTKKWV